jgi:hypothetical protein
MPVIDRLFGEMRPEVKINALIILAENLVRKTINSPLPTHNFAS